MSNEITPVAVVEEYFSALAQGRVPDALAAFDPQVKWVQPGTNRFSGTHVGPEAVGALIGAMMEVSAGTFAVAPTGPAMGNGELVAVPVRFTGTRDGAKLDQPGVDLITVRDGKIVAVALFSCDSPSEDAFWGQA